MKTTLNKIRSYKPHTERWEKLLKPLNKTQADDEEIDIRDIIKSNGIQAAVWCLRAVDDQESIDLFKRRVALIGIEKIKPHTDKYDLIVSFLKTGDESTRKEAEKAACTVADAFNAVAEVAADALNAPAFSAAKAHACAAAAVAWAADRAAHAGAACGADAEWVVSGAVRVGATWRQIEEILLEIIEEKEKTNERYRCSEFSRGVYLGLWARVFY